MVFRGSGVIKFGGAKAQPVAPIETFAQIQLFIDFIDFHRFS